MNTISIRIVQILFLLPLLHQKSAAQTISRESAWQKIAPYFTAPDQFKDQFGSYYSPLKFYDGRPVKNPAVITVYYEPETAAGYRKS